MNQFCNGNSNNSAFITKQELLGLNFSKIREEMSIGPNSSTSIFRRSNDLLARQQMMCTLLLGKDVYLVARHQMMCTLLLGKDVYLVARHQMMCTLLLGNR